MEYAAGGDLFECVVRKGGLRESEARWFFQQLIVAVDYIHRMVRLPQESMQPPPHPPPLRQQSLANCSALDAGR